MPSIRKRGNTWRAEVYSLGTRLSKTFDERADAEMWAHRKAAALKLSRRKNDAINLVPKRVLSAIAATEFGAEQVLSGAIAAPPSCGIYFLIRHGEIVYIGKTTDVFLRLSKHRRDGKEFDAYNFMPCRQANLDDIEAAYIAAFLPYGNMRL